MDFRAGDIQVKFIGERITLVEKHLSELCQGFSNYNRKVSSVRDKGDELTKIVIQLAEGERLNDTLRAAIFGFADSFAAIQDYRDAKVQRVEARIVQSLSQYSLICKHAKDQLRNSFSIRNREMSTKVHLDRVRSQYPTSWQQISQAESDMLKASTESSQSNRHLENQIEDFEENKIKNIKNIFMDFINIQMLFHARAIEHYTKAYNHFMAVDEQEDLETFRNGLRMPSQNSRLSKARSSIFISAPDLPSLKDNVTVAKDEIETLPGRHSIRSELSVKSSKRTSLQSSSRRMSLREDVKDIISSDESEISEEESEDEKSSAKQTKPLRRL